jgi:hypothetical protein
VGGPVNGDSHHGGISMSSWSKPFLAALATAAFFAALAASASARNFSLTNRNIRVVWEAARPIEFLVGGLGTTVRCRVTLEGSFHCATFAKIAEALVGYISRATIEQETCREPMGTKAEITQTSLPWHLRYVSFSGTLPRVNPRIKFMGARLLVLAFFGRACPYRFNPQFIFGGPAGNDITEGNTSVKPDESEVIESEAAECPVLRYLSAPVPITLLGTTTGIRIRLT